ncbi:MAG: prepilin-type N-terminal cleavage/methylation domain-containing protein [Gammaproteobacteria bacterium]|nr:prepilin-type N-terminal cleavage/methylation domain-containing protein [Gammaproteobacteria bacterium]
MEIKSLRGANAGFTLVELMIVVAIIGILSAVAYPSYVKNIEGSRANDAQGGLVSFANALEKRYARQNTFLGNAAGGADTGAPDANLFPSELPIDGDRKYYDLTIAAAGVNTFTLRATPKNAQVGTGFLELDSTGARRWDRDDSGGVDGTAYENSWD